MHTQGKCAIAENDTLAEQDPGFHEIHERRVGKRLPPRRPLVNLDLAAMGQLPQISPDDNSLSCIRRFK